MYIMATADRNYRKCNPGTSMFLIVNIEGVYRGTIYVLGIDLYIFLFLPSTIVSRTHLDSHFPHFEVATAAPTHNERKVHAAVQ